MNWHELQEAADVLDLGVHGKTHCPVTALSDTEISRELNAASEMIKRSTGTQPRVYCYPFGSANERAAAAVRRVGFRAACGTERGLNNLQTDRFLLRRNEVGRGLCEAQFALLMTQHSRTYSQMAAWCRHRHG